MLISFSVENFKSIKSEVTLDMMVTSSVKEFSENCFSSEISNVGSLLRSAAIYGSNGAGKSNILNAISRMRRLILQSHTQTDGDQIEVDPFLLTENGHDSASSFEIDFIHNGTRYSYSFKVTRERVERETLSAYPNLLKQVWFDRKYIKNKNSYSWKFSPNFKGEKDSIKIRTLENTLFFSKATQDNHELIRPLMSFFRDSFNINFAIEDSSETYEFLQTEKGRQFISEFLRDADIGINDIVVEKREFNKKLIPEIFTDEFFKSIQDSPAMQLEAKTVHFIPGTNKQIKFDLERQESLGTVRLFNLAGKILKTLHTGGILLIDELESNLHFKIVNYLISLFHDEEVNTKSAQLIFTTHNPIIMELTKFRRDQIWFLTRSEDMSSQLYNLSRLAKFKGKFKPVRSGQNLLKGYLEGRFYDPPEPDEEALKKVLIEDKFEQAEFNFKTH